MSQVFSASPRYAKIFAWGKIISITAAAQIAIQAIGLISGLIIIRLLSTHEYALYTLANTMLGTMTILADGGVSIGVMAEGGKVWQDKDKLGTVLITGLYIRKKLVFFSLTIAIPILVYLLRHNDASWLITILTLLSLIVAFFTNLTNSILQIAPKLRQDIVSLQKNQIKVNLLRLTLSSMALLVIPWGFIAILFSGISQIWSNTNLKNISLKYTNWKQEPNLEIRKSISKVVQKILPTSIYYCLSSQITIWLTSILGTTTSIAQLGALSRLSMLIVFFTTIFNTLFIPRFSRLPHKTKLLLNRYILSQIGFIFLSIIIVGLTWLFPDKLLWLLGRNYSNLESELLLSIIASCLGLIAASAFSVYTSRGWVIPPIISIPINIGITLIGIIILDISTIGGILILNILINLAQIFMNNIFCIIKILKIKEE